MQSWLNRRLPHPGGNPGANLKPISHRCYLREVAFDWELTRETTYLPLGCLQNGLRRATSPFGVRSPYDIPPGQHAKSQHHAKSDHVKSWELEPLPCAVTLFCGRKHLWRETLRRPPAPSSWIRSFTKHPLSVSLALSLSLSSLALSPFPLSPLARRMTWPGVCTPIDVPPGDTSGGGSRCGVAG